MNLNEIVLKNIQFYRNVRGYSQSYMGLMLGIGQKTYQRVEKGKSKLTILRLEKILKILDLNPNDVFKRNFEL